MGDTVNEMRGKEAAEKKAATIASPQIGQGAYLTANQNGNPSI